MTIHRNSYIIKKSDGTTWKFFFKEDNRIIYSIFKENTWSEFHTLVKDTVKNFSVILLPDDSINVLYQNFDGTINLCNHDGEQWNKQGILTNKEYKKFNIYFDTAATIKKIYIFFSIFDKEKNIASLFYQILDEESNLSEPKIIDIVKYDYKLPFTLYSENDKQLAIIYQKFSVNHDLGYKLLNKDNEKLSNFKLIDTSKYPFKDYSAVMFNEVLHALYVKKENNIDILNYVHDNPLKFSNNKLFKDSCIESCLISIIYDQIFCFWINNNKIYSNFSIDNGNDFSTPPYEQIVNSSDIFKSIYITKAAENDEGILCSELYLIDDEIVQYLFFQNLYPSIKNNDSLSYIKYYMANVSSKVLLYEKEFQQVSKLNVNFLDLNSQLTQKINFLEKSLADKEEKLKLLDDMNIKREEDKNSLKDTLSKNINLHQENIYDKENRIKLLEKINKENQEEILQLKDKFSQNMSLYQKNTIDIDNRINKDKEDVIDILNEKLSENEMIILALIKKIKDLNRNLKMISAKIYMMNNKNY